MGSSVRAVGQHASHPAASRTWGDLSFSRVAHWHSRLALVAGNADEFLSHRHGEVPRIGRRSHSIRQAQPTADRRGTAPGTWAHLLRTWQHEALLGIRSCSRRYIKTSGFPSSQLPSASATSNSIAQFKTHTLTQSHFNHSLRTF